MIKVKPHLIGKGKKKNYYFRYGNTKPVSVTSHFDINLIEFKETGALDAILNVDTRLFIDPFLLPYTSSLELKNSKEKVLSYFQDILTLLSNTNSQYDRTWREAKKKLYFPEAKGFNLGYGSLGSSGSGMGKKFRNQLLEVGFEIVQKGIKDPVIFELVGIFEEGIGCDRISDMICRILYPEFMSFSQRVFQKFDVKTYPIKYMNKIFSLPRNPFRNYEPIILSPKDILKDLPIAHCLDDIDFICSKNKELRDKLSSIIGQDWSNKIKKIKKSDLKRLFLENPKILNDLIQFYKNSKPQFYNYSEDPSGEATWLPLAHKFTSENPLNLELPDQSQSLDTLKKIVGKIINKFGKLIEYNGLNRFLFKDNGKPKPEQAAQLLFYAISNIYCENNRLTVARESNAGRGPVDFKIANENINIIVDLKLSSNTRLKHAYTSQIPIYQKSESSSHAIILVLKVKKNNVSVDKLLKTRQLDQMSGKQTPEIICFDATIQPSASKA